MTEANTNIPKGKQTVLGLYVTSKEAYEKWMLEPDKVKVIDVRTPEEYLFVGHPTMAWKIPVAIQIYEWLEKFVDGEAKADHASAAGVATNPQGRK